MAVGSQWLCLWCYDVQFSCSVRRWHDAAQEVPGWSSNVAGELRVQQPCWALAKSHVEHPVKQPNHISICQDCVHALSGSKSQLQAALSQPPTTPHNMNQSVHRPAVHSPDSRCVVHLDFQQTYRQLRSASMQMTLPSGRGLPCWLARQTEQCVPGCRG